MSEPEPTPSQEAGKGFNKNLKLVLLLGFPGIVIVFLLLLAFGMFGSSQTGTPGKTAEWTGGAQGSLDEVPIEWQDALNSAADKYKIKLEFLAAVFGAGEHSYFHNSWPKYLENPSYGSELNPRLHHCGPNLNRYTGHNEDRIRDPNRLGSWGACIRGPIQMDEQNWATYGQGDLANIELMSIALNAMAKKLALSGASGNQTDENMLRDAAALYNGGSKYSSASADAKNYADKVMIAYREYSIENIILAEAKKYLHVDTFYSQKDRCGPRGFDCSGFASRAYSDAKKFPSGTCLDTTGLATTSLLKKYSYSERRPGDIILYDLQILPNGSITKGDLAHAVIYMGKTGRNDSEEVIESTTSSSRDGVQINPLDANGRARRVFSVFRAVK